MDIAVEKMFTTLTMLTLALTLPLVSPARPGITCPPVDGDILYPTLEEIYYYSDVVVMGKVVERYAAPKSRGPAVYTAEMEVYCVYKGDQVPFRINISDAGKVPERCFQTVFEVGQTYMTYLKKHGNGRLTPTYPEHPEDYKNEMVLVCDITISLPVGLRELPDDVKCENQQDYGYGDDGEKQNETCFSFTPPKDPTYETAKTNDENGKDRLRMSLLLLALLHFAVLVFS